LARHGVEVLFVKAPAMATPEDQLLLQFQGMIAEYERAQILERSHRGVRRQRNWDRWALEFKESLAHLVGDIRQRFFDVASAGVQ
jgi:DNA invertase Pin-like site-specific DNA recombinase